MSPERGKKPLTFDNVREALSLQASRLLNAGETPRILEIGKVQDAVLREGGVTTDSFVITAPC